MRGGYLHNHILLDPVEDHLLQSGATVQREQAVDLCGSMGFIDLAATLRDHRIAFEAELTADRVASDLRKAEAWSATLLVIIVPTRRVARSIQRAVDSTPGARPPGGVWVLPLGPALARLRDCFPFLPALKGTRKKTIKDGA